MNATELSVHERAYRRGAYQAIQYLTRRLNSLDPRHSLSVHEYWSVIAELRDKLIVTRDDLDPKYLGRYLDQITLELWNEGRLADRR